MGRPSELTPEVHARIVSEIQQGQFRAVAARSVGLSHETLKNWMKRGKRGEPMYRELWQDILDAETNIERECVQRVIEKQPGWYLERRFPLRWKPKDRLGAIVPKESEGPPIDGADAASKLRVLAGGRS